ncbi:hypothetical protein ADK47_17635 [Streptomyces rimosus subsp. rimosus]|uniref:Uncharacterized protein n=1 Tax=Streptomyces rimosus subsp. rimosus TaxID=132474 RepID=A0ABY3YXE5_STRRM|nr:hypothetical protein ADK78_15290 [Kitasatospora aureofaciens]KOT37456.1 hypothetical protein ADK84_17780 [Streptomyces sp. NRRL WC-3701]KOT38940.1 hypothetical protein ADK42_16365 [Streptomyces rimosus subsp. rimosus]QDA04169.1 hypothetical protein CTZ40_10870 [Streptomyces rimosus]KOT78495.1 hypothetical protein ADK47_17635 [Streptomyces rimosus subsp. rimosus]
MAVVGAAVLVAADFGVTVLVAADGWRSSGGAHGSCGSDCGAVSVVAGSGISAVGPPCFGAAVLVAADFGVTVPVAADGRWSPGGAHGSRGSDCGAVPVSVGSDTSAVDPPCFGAAVLVAADFDMTTPDTADGRRLPGGAHGSPGSGCATAPATAGSGTSAVDAPAVDITDSVTVGSDTVISVAADDFPPSGGAHTPCGSGCAAAPAAAMGSGTSDVDAPRFGTAGSDTPAVDTAVSVTAVPVPADASRPSTGAHGSRNSGCAAAPATAAVGSGTSAAGPPGLDTPDFGAADLVAPDASRPPAGAHASRGSGC